MNASTDIRYFKKETKQNFTLIPSSHSHFCQQFTGFFNRYFTNILRFETSVYKGVIPLIIKKNIRS